jgi:hypothetical protein
VQYLSRAADYERLLRRNNIVSYYATYLFINSLGMSQNTAAITSGGVTLLFLGGTCSTIYTMEKLGRRTVMLWGAVFCSLFMILFTIGLAVNNDSSNKLAVVSIFLFEFSFGASWCDAPWIVGASLVLLTNDTNMSCSTFPRLRRSTSAIL